MTATNAERFRQVIAAFNSNDVDSVAELISDDVVDHHLPPGLPEGREGLRTWWQVLHAAFDGNLEIHDVVAAADRVASRMTFAGTHVGAFQEHPPTGRSFSASFMSIERFQDGRLVERWEVGDTLGMLQQLGIIPET